MDDAVYMIHGGASYSAPEAVPVTDESDTFATLGEALDEWLRRRNDWTGRYPGWGDGIEADGYIIVLGSEVESFDGWTIAGAFVATDRDLDQLYDFLEPADIARRAVSPTGASDHQQVVWALRAYEGFTPGPTQETDMTACECSEDYGPCEDHCTVVVQREGASTRTAHESTVQYAQDAADLLDEIGGAVEGVRDIDREAIAEAWEMLESNRRMGVAWFPEDDAEEMLDEILRVGDALGSDLSALGYFTFSDDGYWIVKMHEDCPLLDD